MSVRMADGQHKSVSSRQISWWSVHGSCPVGNLWAKDGCCLGCCKVEHMEVRDVVIPAGPSRLDLMTNCKLKDYEVADIRERYRSEKGKKYLVSYLASKYQVTAATIYRVVSGETHR